MQIIVIYIYIFQILWVMSAMRLHRHGPQRSDEDITNVTVTLGLKMEEYLQMPYEVAWSLASFSNHTCNYYPQLEPSEDEAAPWPGKLKGAETHP